MNFFHLISDSPGRIRAGTGRGNRPHRGISLRPRPRDDLLDRRSYRRLVASLYACEVLRLALCGEGCQSRDTQEIRLRHGTPGRNRLLHPLSHTGLSQGLPLLHHGLESYEAVDLSYHLDSWKAIWDHFTVDEWQLCPQ